jgi:hypothetical protein
MSQELPQDVVRFLLDNPKEVEKIQSLMKAIESNAKWHAEIAEKYKNAKTVPCGMYGCTMPRNEMAMMCPSCQQDMREDPDAYK